MDTSFSLDLPHVEATLAFGKTLGTAILAARSAGTPLRTVLLFGDLGSGKTTLTRGLVAALPDGDRAEVCSPSFTVCNEYPTTPLIVHCDLYRDEDADGFASGLPDEAWDIWERTRDSLVLVEWAQRLRETDRPSERLDILMKSCHEKHSVVLIPHGDAASCVIETIRAHV
jgi:tRNA threonylcarbamoyladenosine biosynthesis protein TsaE